MSLYTTITQQTNDELDTLSESQYNLNVAKSVAGADGKPSYNVIFKSANLANNMQVAWTTTYGINWVAEIPAPGTEVTFSGNWQSCGLGQSFNLDKTGQWDPNNNDPYADKDSLNVGNNGYDLAVHIVVGVQDPQTSKWAPIWVSTSELLKNGHGQYKPLQHVQTWYDANTKSATMISHQSTPVQDFDMSKTPKIYFSYSVSKGEWLVPQTTPFYENSA